MMITLECSGVVALMVDKSFALSAEAGEETSEAVVRIAEADVRSVAAAALFLLLLLLSLSPLLVLLLSAEPLVLVWRLP
jgi:hypothetical protein